MDTPSPTFQLGDVAAAAGVAPELLRSWISRGFILLQTETGDRQGKGAGRYRKFTINRALQVAITAELVRFGLHPRHAAEAALPFTDISSPGRPIRLPGKLFEGAETALIVGGPSERASVLKVDGATRFLVPLAAGRSAVIVHLNPLYEQVVSRLEAI